MVSRDLKVPTSARPIFCKGKVCLAEATIRFGVEPSNIQGNTCVFCGLGSYPVLVPSSLLVTFAVQSINKIEVSNSCWWESLEEKTPTYHVVAIMLDPKKLYVNG